MYYNIDSHEGSMMSSDKEQDGKNAENKRLTSEEKLIHLLERARHNTAEECFTHFEKFHQDEQEFQRNIQIEDREYERKKQEQDILFKKEHMRNERFWKVLATILAIGGFYLLFWSGVETAKESSRRAVNEHQIDLIRQDIAEQKETLQVATEAISHMRSVYAEILRNCEYGHPLSMEKQDEMRREAWQGVVDSLAMIPYTFNEAVLDKGKELIQFDEHIKDLCTYKDKENLDYRLLQYKRGLFDLANQVMEKNKQKIEKLK